jgi:UDPglucose 6-dehydrogenase
MSISVSVIGLGKLGAGIAAAIASRGHEVIGVDVRREAVELLNSGRAPVYETDLQEILDASHQRIRAVTNCSEAINNSGITLVVVPTPSDQQGAFSLSYVEAAFRECGRALARKRDYHVMVLVSTVLPGATRMYLKPVLERESGRLVGRNLGLCYSPQFVALGTVIRDFLTPDFLLIGESDERAGTCLESFYRTVVNNSAPCARMSIENAEITKIAVNTYVTTKITFANMIGDLCERIPGADVDAVTRALSLDRRIGQGCLTAGLGYGGPCFPRDNLALAYLARTLGARADLAEATNSLNRALPDRIAERFKDLLQPGKTAAVLGLSYKPGTTVVEESQAIYLVKSLAKSGLRILACDPVANGTARLELGDAAVLVESVEECLKPADLVFIATPDPLFKALPVEIFAGKTVVDFWGLLAERLACRSDVKYFRMGRAVNESSRAEVFQKVGG